MSYTTTWIGSPNSRTRSGYVRWITLHWMVGRLAGTDAVFQKYPGTATHYGIEGDRVHQYVLESRAAPGTGTNRAIPWDISIEHAGGYLVNGVRVKPSPETHQTSAELCAAIARRHGLGKLVVGRNVFRHRDWVATSCPGSLDVEWIVAQANAINGHGNAPAGGSGTQLPDPEVKWIQERLVVHGYDPGGIDGIWGPDTEAAVKAFQTNNNLVPDGEVGTITRPLLAAQPEGETMSAADVEALKVYVNERVGYLAGIVRRETRARVFHNTATGQYMAADTEGIYYEIFKGGKAEIDTLKSALIVASEAAEVQSVDQATWDGIIARIEGTRAAVRATAAPVTIDPAALAAAIELVIPKIAEAVIEATGKVYGAGAE